jgi:excisionase family DNA binding protein
MTKPLPRDAERRLLDYAHLAAYLSVSLRSAKQLAADGQIRKVKIGHRVLFDRDDVDTYIERIKRSA